MLIPEILLNHHALAIASAFFCALSNILAKTILKDVTAKDILGINFLMMTVIMAVLSPGFFEINGPLITVIPIILLISVVDFFANFFFFKAFEKSDVSIATPMLALAPCPLLYLPVCVAIFGRCRHPFPTSHVGWSADWHRRFFNGFFKTV